MEDKDIEHILDMEYGEIIETTKDLQKFILEKMHDEELIDIYANTAYKVYKKCLNNFQPDIAAKLALNYMQKLYEIKLDAGNEE